MDAPRRLARRSTARELSTVPGVASRQGGVFTRAQARAEGWTTDQVKHRVAGGHWVRLTPSALVAAGTPTTAGVLAWAATVTWPGAVLGHRTAALLHGFPVGGAAEAVAHVVLPVGRHPVPGIRPHVADLEAVELCRLGNGLTVTSPRRTALDCLASLPPDDAGRLLAWVVTRRVLTRADLAAAARERVGRAGTPQLLRLLRETRTGALSTAERRAHALLRRRGITGWVANARVEDDDGLVGVVDLLFPRHRVVVEIDGFEAHGTREAFVVDRRRQNRLVAAGYVVLRFTWDDLTHRPDAVAAEILAALGR